MRLTTSNRRQCNGNSFHLPIGVRLGLAYGLTYWLCNYWGLFLTILLIPCSVCFWNRRIREQAFWRQLLWAGLMALIMIGPFAWLQHSQSGEHNWPSARSANLVYDLSARWRDHTDVPWKTMTWWLEFPEPARENWWGLGGGGLKLILAPLGLIMALTSRQRRQLGCFFAFVFSVLAFGISLRPTIQYSRSCAAAGRESVPTNCCNDMYRGSHLIRSPFRFAIFVQLAVVWLSVEALEGLNPARWLTRRKRVPESCGWRLHQRS